MILIPLMSYAGAVLLVDANRQNGWVLVPREMARTVSVPLVGAVPYLYAHILVAILLALVGFAALTVIYALVYRAVGPGTLGPLDAPPERRRPRRVR
jgi:hypothetical protein